MAKPSATRVLSLPAPRLGPIALRPLAAALVPKSAIHPPLSRTSTSSPHRHFSRHVPSSNFALWPRKAPMQWHFGESPREWKVEEVQELLENPLDGLIIIDVREPQELAETGRIPGAYNMPIQSNPDAIALGPEVFYQRFGFNKPGTTTAERTAAPRRRRGDPLPSDETDAKDEPEEEVVNEVLFYCKAGVRSKTAAHLAALDIGWPNVQSGDMKGGWVAWTDRGGKVEKA